MIYYSASNSCSSWRQSYPLKHILKIAMTLFHAFCWSHVMSRSFGFGFFVFSLHRLGMLLYMLVCFQVSITCLGVLSCCFCGCFTSCEEEESFFWKLGESCFKITKSAMRLDGPIWNQATFKVVQKWHLI